MAGNTGSITHGVRPGIKPTTSWILVGFVTTEPQQELLFYLLIFYFFVMPVACGNSQTRDGTCATAASRAAAVTMSDP